jgi:myosin heavy subunit
MQPSASNGVDGGERLSKELATLQFELRRLHTVNRNLVSSASAKDSEIASLKQRLNASLEDNDKIRKLDAELKQVIKAGADKDDELENLRQKIADYETLLQGRADEDGTREDELDSIQEENKQLRAAISALEKQLESANVTRERFEKFARLEILQVNRWASQLQHIKSTLDTKTMLSMDVPPEQCVPFRESSYSTLKAIRETVDREVAATRSNNLPGNLSHRDPLASSVDGGASLASTARGRSMSVVAGGSSDPTHAKEVHLPETGTSQFAATLADPLGEFVSFSCWLVEQYNEAIHRWRSPQTVAAVKHVTAPPGVTLAPSAPPPSAKSLAFWKK